MFKSLSTPKKRLADQVYDQLLDAIQNGAIQPNDQIVQEKLADQFEISRTPVREALLRLEQERIIEAAKRGGFKIRVLSERETIEIYQARTAVESHALRLLAMQPDKNTLDSIRKTIRREENLKEQTTRAYFKANQAIHRVFVEATGNRYLLELFDTIWNRSTSFQTFALLDPDDRAKSLVNHEELVEIIARGDPMIAQQKMVEHIDDGLHLQQGDV